MKEHIHCKRCDTVIEYPGYDAPLYWLKGKLYYKVGLCMECILTEVIKKAEYKLKKKRSK